MADRPQSAMKSSSVPFGTFCSDLYYGVAIICLTELHLGKHLIIIINTECRGTFNRFVCIIYNTYCFHKYSFIKLTRANLF